MLNDIKVPQETQNKILEFLKNPDSDSELKIPRLPLSYYVNYLTIIGYEDTEEYETNSWECDFWYYCEKDGTKLCLSGDLWYDEDFKLTFC